MGSWNSLTTIRRAALPVVLAAGAAFTLAACNTTSGLGQDVSAGGKAITKSADDVKDKM